MFDIGWSEFLLIGIVALIVIGPKELPGVLRTIGQGIGKVRRMASEFQGQFQEAMREAEMAELKKSVDEMSAAARGFQYYDPVNPDGLEPARDDKPAEPSLPPPQQTAAAEPAPQEQSIAGGPEPQVQPVAAEPAPPTQPEPPSGAPEPPRPGEGRAP
jgi:sec-independent protein translocase protein TatB